MKFSNQEIYNISTIYIDAFKDVNNYIPAKANFFLQKNMQKMTAAAEEIDRTRIAIVQEYGELNEEAQEYKIPKEKLAAINKEMADLFALEQEIEIKTISIESFGSVEFTPAQMQAIMFMIED